jgi:hypothetical protein
VKDLSDEDPVVQWSIPQISRIYIEMSALGADIQREMTRRSHIMLRAHSLSLSLAFKLLRFQ